MISCGKPIVFILGLLLLCDKSASSSDEALTNYLTKIGESEKIMVVGTGTAYGTPYPENYFLVDNNAAVQPTKVADIGNGPEFSDQYNGVFDVVVFECVPVFNFGPYINVARFLKNGGKFITSFPGKPESIPPNHELSLSPLDKEDKDGIFFRNTVSVSPKAYELPPQVQAQTPFNKFIFLPDSLSYTVYVDGKTEINSNIRKKAREEIVKIFSQDIDSIFKDFKIIRSKYSDYWQKEDRRSLIEATRR